MIVEGELDILAGAMGLGDGSAEGHFRLNLESDGVLHFRGFLPSFEWLWSEDGGASPQMHLQTGGLLKLGDPLGGGVLVLDPTAQAMIGWSEYGLSGFSFREGRMELTGGLVPGYSEMSMAGLIRWTGDDLEVSTGTEWVSLVRVPTESDPVFRGSAASQIEHTDLQRWNLAAGFVENHSEGDPLFLSSPAAGIGEGDIDRWNASHQFTSAFHLEESDPLFSASVASLITEEDIGNWRLAFQWGDHAAAGYAMADSIPGFGAIIEGTFPVWGDGHLESSPVRIANGAMVISRDEIEEGDALRVEGEVRITGDLVVEGRILLQRQGDIFMGPFGNPEDAGPSGAN